MKFLTDVAISDRKSIVPQIILILYENRNTCFTACFIRRICSLTFYIIVMWHVLKIYLFRDIFSVSLKVVKKKKVALLYNGFKILLSHCLCAIKCFLWCNIFLPALEFRYFPPQPNYNSLFALSRGASCSKLTSVLIVLHAQSSNNFDTLLGFIHWETKVFVFHRFSFVGNLLPILYSWCKCAISNKQVLFVFNFLCLFQFIGQLEAICSCRFSDLWLSYFVTRIMQDVSGHGFVCCAAWRTYQFINSKLLCIKSDHF